MRKKVLIIALVWAMCLTGCTSDEEIQKETMEYANSNKNDYEIAREYEDIVADIDFSDSRIYAELKENLTVDATIMNDAPDVLGIYEYVKNEKLDEAETLKMEVELVKLVDDFYGRDVTITFSEALDSEADSDASEMTVYSGSSPRFCMSGIDSKYFIGGIWDDYYSSVKSDYDEVMIEGKIDDFVAHFQSILPNGVGKMYRCLHFDNEFWKTSGAVAAGDWSIKETIDMDYYWIRLYDEVESGIVCNEGSQNIKMEEIGETSWFEAFEPDVTGMIYCGSRNSYVDLYLYENGELMAFEIFNDIDEGECLKVEEVLDAKEALGLVYDLYKDVKVYQQVTIKNMEMCYRVLPASELDENGYRAATVTPIWIVKFTKKGSEIGEKTIVFDAVSGKLLYREI